MSRITTDWVLELGESKAGLEDLISTVDRYNVTVGKAAQLAKVGFSQTAQQQQQVNQQLVLAVQNQSAVNKAVDAGAAVVAKVTAAEKELGAASTEASLKAGTALDLNIQKQQALTASIDATAAAAQRSAAGGIRVNPNLPVPAATAVIGAVPSPAVTAVTAEFERQIALAKEASVAAQAYLEGVTAEAAGARAAAARVNNETRDAKALYEANLAALAKVQEKIFELNAARADTEPGKQQDRINAALEKQQLLERNITDATVDSKQVYVELNQVALATNAGLAEKIALQGVARNLVKETADAERGLQVAAKQAIQAANEEARALGLLGGAEAKLADAIARRKLAQSKPELSAIGQEIAALEKEIAEYKKLGQTAAAPQATGGGFFSGLIGSLSIAAAGFLTLQKAYQFFTDGLKNAADFAGIRSSFTALAGSVQAGGQEFDFVDEKARELGLDLKSTADSYRLLYASAKEANLSTEQTRDIFSAITAEGKVLGISNARLENSLRAVSQMLGKGVVSSEELRRQLGEALPDATAQAAKALGITTAELDKMLKSGKILAADFLPKFAAQLQKTYGGATADAATQLQSNLNRISNSYAKFSAEIVGALAPAVAAIANFFDGGETQAAKADRATTAYQRQAGAVVDLNSKIPPLVLEAETLQKKTSLNADEQERLKKLLEEIALAIPGASKGFDAYGVSLGVNMEAVAAFMKNNAALAERLKSDALRQNKALLDELQAQADDVVEKLNRTVKVDGVDRLAVPTTTGPEFNRTIFNKPLDTQKESDEESARLLAQNEQLLTRIAAVRKLIDGDAKKATEDDGKKVKTLSIILELQTKIKALTDARALVTEGPVTAANPNGGGKAAILDYTAQIDKAQAELDKLLNKNQKKVRDTSLAALKSLQAEEKKLRESYNKALLDELKDAGQARAAEQLRQDFNEIDLAEKTIKSLERAYAAKGGRGANADGKLGAQQQQQIDNLRLLAVQKYNEEIDRINREATAKSLDLQADSDEKELAQLQAKFAEEIRVTQVANDALGTRIERAATAGNQALVLSLGASKIISDQLLADLRNAAAEQEKLLVRQQALNAIDQQQGLRTGSVEANQLPLAQTNDATGDGSGEAQTGAARQLSAVRALYEKLFPLETDLEKKKQKALLQIQLDANNARLLLYQDDFTQQGIIVKAGLLDANAKIQGELGAIKEPTGRKFDLMKLLGVAPDDQDKVKQALAEAGTQIIAQIGAFAQANVDAANTVAEASKQNLQDKRSDLDTEIALNKQGFASNVELRRQELEDAKGARDKALDEQKKALKAQQALETVQQTVGLITASVDIIKGFSAIPFIGLPLGIAAVATMFGFFVAAKAKAAGATKLEKGGLHGGNSHANGGNKYLATDGSYLEIEEGEFTVRKSSTRKHREFIEAINEDDEKRIQFLSLRALLKGAGVRMNADTPKRIQRNQGLLMEKTAAASLNLAEVTGLLTGIHANTVAKPYSYETDTHRVEVTGNHTRRIRKA